MHYDGRQSVPPKRPAERTSGLAPARDPASARPIVYVTASLPFGAVEAFIIPELHALRRRGLELAIVPVRPQGPIVHEDAATLAPVTRAERVVSWRIARHAALELVASPRRCARALARLVTPTRPRITLKNLVIFPKALWLARFLREYEVGHVHAHWGSTSASIAMAAAEVAGVPWSFTVHRWDIREDNILRRKARSACFVRTISRDGLADLRGRVDETSNIVLLYMGVDVPASPAARPPAPQPFRILVPASLVPVKGHAHVLDAVAELRARGLVLELEIVGDGPLRGQLTDAVLRLGLEGCVAFRGTLSHQRLLHELSRGSWDVVVLGSVPAAGEKEGIPVSLVEAMSFGLPVVATSLGGIPELLGDGAGLLVPPGDAQALADVIEQLACDPELRARVAQAARARVEEAFDIERTAGTLASLFANCQPSLEPWHYDAGDTTRTRAVRRSNASSSSTTFESRNRSLP